MVTVEEVVKVTGVSPEAAQISIDLAERKLSGRRIVVPDDREVKRAYQYVANDPEFLRERNAQLGRGEGVGASPIGYSNSPAPAEVRDRVKVIPNQNNPSEPTTVYYSGGREVGRTTYVNGQEVASVSRYTKQGTTVEAQGQSATFSNQGIQITSESNQPLTLAQNPQARIGLPIKERLSIAYKSAGKTQGGLNLRGVYRGYEELVSIGLEKVPAYRKYVKSGNARTDLTVFKVSQASPKFAQKLFKISPEKPQVALVLNSGTFENVAIATALSPPTLFKQGFEIERDLYQINRVKVMGVTQQVKGDTVYTDAAFKVSRGRSSVKGVVTSKSKLLGSQNGVDAVLSASKGKTFTDSFLFPTGRQVIKQGSEFKAVEFTKVTAKDGGLFFSKSIKGQTGIGAATRYKSVAVSSIKGDYLTQIGATISTKSRAFTTAILKIKPATDVSQSITFFPTSKAGQIYFSTTTPETVVTQGRLGFKVAGLQATVSAVASNVLVPTVDSINFLPASATAFNLKSTRPIQRTTTTLFQNNNQGAAQRTTPIIDSSFKQRSNQIVTPAFQSAQQQDLKQPVIQVVNLNQEQAFQQRQASLNLQIFNQPERTRVNIPFPTPTTTSRSRTPRGFSSPFEGKKGSASFGVYPVFLRRFGKFNIVGFGSTSKQAVSIGRRAAGTTLGATFKIGGGAKLPNSITGFKTKNTKQGRLFIELPKYRLSTRSEIGEINFYRGQKGGRRR